MKISFIQDCCNMEESLNCSTETKCGKISLQVKGLVKMYWRKSQEEEFSEMGATEFVNDSFLLLSESWASHSVWFMNYFPGLGRHNFFHKQKLIRFLDAQNNLPTHTKQPHFTSRYQEITVFIWEILFYNPLSCTEYAYTHKQTHTEHFTCEHRMGDMLISFWYFDCCISKVHSQELEKTHLGGLAVY